MPIHTVLDMSVPRSSPRPARNFRATDWKKFNDHLTITLANAPNPKRIRTPGEFRETLDVINQALKYTIYAKVPKNIKIPHTKRWWNQDLTKARREKNKLANLVYKWRGLPDHHAHENYKCATKTYAELIEKSKKNITSGSGLSLDSSGYISGCRTLECSDKAARVESHQAFTCNKILDRPLRSFQ